MLPSRAMTLETQMACEDAIAAASVSYACATWFRALARTLNERIACILEHFGPILAGPDLQRARPWCEGQLRGHAAVRGGVQGPLDCTHGTGNTEPDAR